MLKTLITIIKGYRLFLSPWLGNSCRFEPTCSLYALQALQSKGAAHGSYLTFKRVIRCHPWCEGGFDPVPMQFSNINSPSDIGPSSTKSASQTP